MPLLHVLKNPRSLIDGLCSEPRKHALRLRIEGLKLSIAGKLPNAVSIMPIRILN